MIQILNIYGRDTKQLKSKIFIIQRNSANMKHQNIMSSRETYFKLNNNSSEEKFKNLGSVGLREQIL